MTGEPRSAPGRRLHRTGPGQAVGVAAAASLGIKRVFFINAWRVDKSYWKTQRLAPESIREHAILGLEQARDTVLPQIELRRLFRPFVEDELPAVAAGTTALVAHPYAAEICPRAVPEGGLSSGDARPAHSARGNGGGGHRREGEVTLLDSWFPSR